MLASAPQPNRRVLVIDDNESIHDDFRKLLGGWIGEARPADKLAALILGEKAVDEVPLGFEVECAFSGEAGLRRLLENQKQNRPFAVAFVDVRMPTGWDGIETIERLWAEDPDLQVVLCTAFSDYSWRDLARRFLCSDRLVILKKPFDAVEALQLAAALSEKWKLGQESRKRLAHLERTIDDQQENRALAEAQFAAVLAERNRMAREIHDTLAQGFAAIFVQLEVVRDTLSADPDVARKHLDRARDLSRESLEQARRTIWNIRSQALETAGLARALEDAGRNLVTDTRAKFIFTSTGVPHRLSEVIENNLLRIGQEAITNAIKHSQAGEISACLEFRDNSVLLEVRDDGIGNAGPADGDRKIPGFGLLGIEERAREMGAALVIKSNEGRGMVVSIEVAL